MRPGYLLLVHEEGAGPEPRLGRIAAGAGLLQAFSAPGITAFTADGRGCVALGDHGCVLGTLFDRRGARGRVEALSTAAVESIVGSSGEELLSRFWGGYVAVLRTGDSVRVLRDPSAALPCYGVKGHGFVALASDAGLLLELGPGDAAIDWNAIAAQFYRAGVPAAATGLAGIRELLAGFALDLPAGLECQQPFWSPWDHAGPGAARPDRLEEGLARTVADCVRSWACVHGRLLVSVSGGLDSSIVAAALAGCGADAVGLTLYGEDPSGDERPFARALCDHLGLPLVERPYSMEHIDILEPLGAHLPRPSDRTHAQSYERAHLDVASELGAAAFVTGNGGDSLFGYSQSAGAAADRLLAQGISSAWLRSVRDVSRQTGCGVLRAAGSAIRIARSPHSYKVRPDTMFLHPDAVASLAADPIGHPWLDAPAGALPGKAAHIASILRIQLCLEPGRARQLPVVNPLVSQPVMEFCLRVPSWEWRSGGVDRSLARRAFRGVLPDVLLRRRVKGGPDGFAASILDRFRRPISERLLCGSLVREGIVDGASLEAVLGDTGPRPGEERARILEFLAAEAWIDSWRSRARPGGPARSA